MLKKSQCFVIGGCLFVCCRERFVLFTRWGRWTRKQNFRPMEENRRHECQVSEEVGREKTQIWRREWPGAGSRGRNWERMMTSVGFSADPSWKRSLVQEIGLKRRFYSHSGMMWSTNQEKAGFKVLSLPCSQSWEIQRVLVPDVLQHRILTGAPQSQVQLLLLLLGEVHSHICECHQLQDLVIQWLGSHSSTAHDG